MRALIPLLFLLLGTLSIAQTQDGDDPFKNRLVDPPERKQPKMLLKPDRATPPEQLAYAEELRAGGHARKAEKQFRALVHTWHESPEAPKAQLAYAELLEARGKYRKSFEQYQYLIEHFGRNYDYDGVLERQFSIAHLLMNQRRGKFLFFKGFVSSEQAIPLFETIIANAPNWNKSDLAQFYIGVIHEQAGEYAEAVSAFERVYFRYATSEYTTDAAYRRANCLVAAAKDARNDETAWREALTALLQFVRLYPASDKVPEAERQIAELKSSMSGRTYNVAHYYDKIAKKPRAALLSYRYYVEQFPTGEYAAAARTRIEQLQQEVAE